MAKRRKDPDAEDEDKPFKMPKFDEKAFLKRERRNIKITFITFLFACVMAVICFGFWVLLDGSEFRWPLVLMVGIFNASFLRYILLRLNFDLSELTKKNWFTNYAVYLCVLLIVLIVLVNPPFYDDESPKIDLAVLPEMQELGGDILIVAKITDNSMLSQDEITFTIDGASIASNDYEYVDNILKYTYKSPDTLNGDETHTYKISVKDNSGNMMEKEGTFVYSNDTISLALPNEGDTLKAASDVKFRVQPSVWRVYYTVNDGQPINATQQDDRVDYYKTTPEFVGWPAGTENVTVNVTAELLYNFENHYIVDENGKAVPIWFVNYINDTSTYTFDVDDESVIGKTDDKSVSRPSARFVGAPGFEAVVFIAALLAVVLILKYKKKDRRN